MNFPKAIIAAIFVSAAAISSGAQVPDKAKKPKFDAALAKKLGADEYGMKTFVMAFLKTGPVKPRDKAEQEELMAGHLANIGRLAEAGKIVLAGPFTNGGEMRGIFIFDVGTIEEAEKLTESDPAVKKGIFKVEYIKWYGSAALLELSGIHKSIAEKDF